MSSISELQKSIQEIDDDQFLELEQADYDYKKFIEADYEEEDIKSSDLPINIEEFTSENIEDICTHPNAFTVNGVEKCPSCGIEVYQELDLQPEWRYYGDMDNKHSSDPSRCHTRRSEDKNIYKDIEKYDLPPNVKEQSNEFYFIITQGQIRRANFRKALIYACVYNSYKCQNIPQLPEELRVKFNLSKKEISKGLNFFNLNMKKAIKPVYIQPSVFIEHIMKKFTTNSKHVEHVNKLYGRIHNRSPVLNSSNPQSVISALIFYYFKMIGQDISCAHFSKLVKLSTIIVERNSKTISKLLGTSETVKLN